MKYSDKQMVAAVEEARKLKGSKDAELKSVRDIALKHGVPKSTLHLRLNSGNDEIPSRGRPTFLSSDEEKLVVGWAIRRAMICCPITRKELTDAVQQTYNKVNKKTLFKDNRPSLGWIYKLQRRHNLSLRRSEDLDGGRTRVTEVGIRDWFKGLKSFLESEKALDILKQPLRIFNGDEVGFQLEPQPKSVKLIVPKGIDDVFIVKHRSSKKTVTVMGTFNASGVALAPYFLYPYDRVPAPVKNLMPPGFGYGNTKKGWMTQNCFLAYLRDFFYPAVSTIPGISFPVLLVIDGVSSHISIEVAEYCKGKGIILYALPANTSHILQPADVGIFGPLKKKWFHESRNWTVETQNPVTLHNIAMVFKRAWDTLSPEIIQNAFKACGLYPFDVNLVDFSKCVSTRLSILEDREKEILEETNEEQDEEEQLTEAMDEVHNTVTLSDGEGDSRKGIVSDAFTVFQKAMPPIARAHMESTIPQALLDEFRSCRNSGGIWKGAVHHTSLFNYWKKFFDVNSENLLLKVAKALPPLPNPITPLLRKEVRINAITSKESLSLLRGRKAKKVAKNSVEIDSSEETVDFENDVNTSFEPQQEQLAGEVDQSIEKEVKQASVKETTSTAYQIPGSLVLCTICKLPYSDKGPKKRGRPKMLKPGMTNAIRCKICHDWFHFACIPGKGPEFANSYSCSKCLSSTMDTNNLDDLSEDPHVFFVDLLMESQPEKEKSTVSHIQPYGLRSMKNTCYVNAALQTLFNIPYFMEKLKQMVKNMKDSASSSTISEYLCAIFDILTSNENENSRNALVTPYYAELLNELPKIDSTKTLFHYGVQGDAGELLFYLLGHIRYGDLSNLVEHGTHANPVELSLQMQIIKIIHCKGCGEKYIDENIEENYTFGLLLPSGVRSMDFLDLLDVNFDYEERRTCNSCGSSVCRVKRRFYHTPEIIIFQLLYSSLRRINNTPKDMNIGKWVSNPNVDDKSTFYCLKSMIQHIGNNENEGHYVSYIQDRYGENKWSLFDNEKVSNVSFDQINEEHCYRRSVLFVYVKSEYLSSH